MYRFTYPVLLFALLVVVDRYLHAIAPVQASQKSRDQPQHYDYSNFDSLVATFSRPGITSDEQRAILRTLGSQPNNSAGIRFLVRMMEVDFSDGQEPEIVVGGADAMPQPNLLAAYALTQLGAPAAPHLVDEYFAFHGKTRHSEWPHHFTKYNLDQHLVPFPEQTASWRLYVVVTTIISDDGLARASVAYLEGRSAELPATHPTRQAAVALMHDIRHSYHIADWQRVFPDRPYLP